MKYLKHAIEAFECCKGCSYLVERVQVSSDPKVMAAFCQYYQLHFESVRQIPQMVCGCMHYDEGNI